MSALFPNPGEEEEEVNELSSLSWDLLPGSPSLPVRARSSTVITTDSGSPPHVPTFQSRILLPSTPQSASSPSQRINNNNTPLVLQQDEEEDEFEFKADRPARRPVVLLNMREDEAVAATPAVAAAQSGRDEAAMQTPPPLTATTAAPATPIQEQQPAQPVMQTRLPTTTTTAAPTTPIQQQEQQPAQPVMQTPPRVAVVAATEAAAVPNPAQQTPPRAISTAAAVLPDEAQMQTPPRAVAATTQQDTPPPPPSQPPAAQRRHQAKHLVVTFDDSKALERKQRPLPPHEYDVRVYNYCWPELKSTLGWTAKAGGDGLSSSWTYLAPGLKRASEGKLNVTVFKSERALMRHVQDAMPELYAEALDFVRAQEERAKELRAQELRAQEDETEEEEEEEEERVPVMTNKKQRRMSEMQIMDGKSWSETWNECLEQGWTVRAGTGLESWRYLPPNSAGKRPNVDYFTSPEHVVAFLQSPVKKTEPAAKRNEFELDLWPYLQHELGWRYTTGWGVVEYVFYLPQGKSKRQGGQHGRDFLLSQQEVVDYCQRHGLAPKRA